MADRSIVVRLRAEVAQFKQAMGAAARSTGLVGDQSEKTSRRGESAFSRMAQSARQNEQAWSTVGRTLAVAGGAMAAFGGSLMAAGIQYNSLRQRATQSLSAVTGSTEEAADQMRKLDEYGKNSWLMRDSLIKAQQTMTGFGIETEKVIPYMDALGEAVAATGGNNQDFEELALVMGQIQSQGKITARELMQFGMRGVDAAQMIGDAMGITAGEVRDKITAGALDAGDALDYLAEGMKDRYDGASDLIRDTFEGAVDDVKAAFRDLGAALASPFVDPEGGGLAVTALNKLADAMRAMEDAPSWLQGTVGILGALATAATIGGAAFMLGLPKYLAFKDALTVLAEAHPALSRTARSMGRVAGAATRLGVALGAAVALTAGTKKLVDTIQGFDGLDRSVEMTKNRLLGLSDAGDAYNVVFGDMIDNVRFSTDRFSDLGTAVHEVANQGFADKLTSMLNLDADGIGNATDRFEDMGAALADLSANDLPAAQEAFAFLWEASGGTQQAADELLQIMPAYRDALAGVANDMGLAADDSTLLALATGEVSGEMGGAAGAAQAGVQAFFDVADSAREAAEANAELKAQIEASVDGLVDWTEGIDDADFSLSGWVDSLEEQAAALANFDDNMNSVHDRVTGFADDDAADAVIQKLIDMGDEGALAGDKLANASDEDFQRAIEAMLGLEDQSDSTSDSLAELLAQDSTVEIDADTSDADETISNWQETMLDDTTTTSLDADTEPANLAANLFYAQVENALSTTNMAADTDPAQGNYDIWDQQVTGATSTTNLNADDAGAQGVFLDYDNRVSTAYPTTNLDAQDGPARGTFGVFDSWASRQSPTTPLYANDGPGRGDVAGFTSWANSQSATTSVDASTSGGRSSVSRFLSWVSGQSATVHVKSSGTVSKAGGGPIHGPGTGTSDSIPAMLSNGEHVWTAREVAAAGGHGAIMAMRQQALGGVRGYAAGGAVSGSRSRSAAVPAAQSLTHRVSSSLTQTVNNYALPADQPSEFAKATLFALRQSARGGAHRKVRA